MGFYSNVIIPFFYDCSMNTKKVNEGRKNILSKIKGEEVLEIGIGTAINLQFYPSSVKKVIGVDSNKGMLKQAAKKISANNIEVDLKAVGSESLPFPDGRFETIVSTYTLCSIKNINEALKEIFRVLKSGGKFYFLEHGLAEDIKVQKWQHRLNPVQNIWADGCNLNRDMKTLITNAGLKIIDLKNYYMKRDPKIVGYMYEGIAVK